MPADINLDLLAVRIKAFLFEAGSLCAVVLAGVLVSPEFQAIVTAHFGNGLVTSLIVLLLAGLAKHVRNVSAISAASESLGSTREAMRHVNLI